MNTIPQYLHTLSTAFAGQAQPFADKTHLSRIFTDAGFRLVDILSSDSVAVAYFTVGVDDLPFMVRFLRDTVTQELIPREVIAIPDDYEDLDDPDDYYRHFLVQAFTWGVQAPANGTWSAHYVGDGRAVLLGGGDEYIAWCCALVDHSRVRRVLTVPRDVYLRRPQYLCAIAACRAMLDALSLSPGLMTLNMVLDGSTYRVTVRDGMLCDIEPHGHL